MAFDVCELNRFVRDTGSSAVVVRVLCNGFRCYSASQFLEFHELLAQHRAGDLALRIVEYEHNRHKFRLEVRLNLVHL